MTMLLATFGTYPKAASGPAPDPNVFRDFLIESEATFSTSALARYRMEANGFVTLTGDGITPTPTAAEKWRSDALAGTTFTDVEVRATKTAGSFPVGTLDTWIPVPASWSLSKPQGTSGVSSCQLTLELRAVANPSVIIDTTTVTLYVAGEGEGGI